jgi:ADP-dependent NAD(P)H-hydrate dehydratase / NAD(P)H-hydrate epimerase
MSAITAAAMRGLEQAAMARGWSEESLMDLAGRRLASAIAAFFPVPGHIVAYLGKGHNAGDALVALRWLRDGFGWTISARSAFAIEETAPLTRRKWSEVEPLSRHADAPLAADVARRPWVLLDGLLGIGASGPLREPLLSLAMEMVRLRETAGARIAAIDVPSGTDPDSGEIFPGAVTADISFMIGAAKQGLLKATAAAATGALAIVPIEPLAPPAGGALGLISPQSLSCGKAPRPFDFHKGQAGRVGILAGSHCYAGAAAMTAIGALRGGAGLITLHVPRAVVDRVSAKVPAEIIVHACDDPAELLEARYDALALGPGLGKASGSFAAGLESLIAKTEVPTLLDADALNFLAEDGRLSLLKANHVLTPHPGEFRRLAPDLADLPREEAARQFATRWPATLLLKGSRTLVIQGSGTLWCNATGTPGMASGGQGDLLSGVIAARLAAGLNPVDAAATGAWLCGRAAERVIACGGQSEESLAPGDLVPHLGGAFTDWRDGRR